MTVDDLIDTYRIRMRLEGLATAMATSRLSEEDKARLEKAMEMSEYYMKRQDTEQLKELDTSFHSTIYAASGNRMLYKILTELHRNIRTYRKLSLTMPGRLESSIAEHRDIFKAMLEGDSQKADELTSLHIERAMNNMVEAMKRGDNDLALL